MQDESEQVKLPDIVGNGLALSLYEQGIRFHESGKFDEALATFEEALKHDPQFAPAHNGRGSVLFSKGDVEAAFSALNEAIRLDGKFPKALANRGSTYASIGEFERALADLNEALRLDSECEAAFIGRAQCFFGMQRYEDAIEDLSRCIDFNANTAWAHAMRGLAYHYLEELDDALSDFNESIRLDSTVAWIFSGRGCIKHAAEEYEAAIKDYDEAVRLQPEYQNAYLNRGRAHHEVEVFDQAISDYSKAIALDGTEAEPFYFRALAWEQQGDLQKALDDLTEAIRLDPTMRRAYKHRAQLWEQVGNADEAEQDLDRADELRANTRMARNTMRKSSIYQLLQKHFTPEPLDNITVTERRFPSRVRADLQRAVDHIVSEKATLLHFCGVRKRHSHEGINLSELLVQDRDDPALSVPPQYEEVDIGEEETVKCAKAGLWLLEMGEDRLALFLEPPTYYGRMGGLRFQVATRNDEAGTALSNTFLKQLERAVAKSTCYKGKILSLEEHQHYSGAATGIAVHKLKTLKREQVILPRKTLELLERNVIHFVRHRRRLNDLGVSTKKGLLFYGPPGTGKTHTIHYLAGALEGHTTLLISAEQVGLLGEYMTLARLLQPSIVVIEDVDLIARDRTEMGSVCEEVLLNKLLNEMDGLKPDSDVLFILTTNRPEALEMALASRPGRVDQAIEFPLPDREGREKLVHLYACGIHLTDEVVQTTVNKTEKVSAAFIKELMRRALQFQLERDGSSAIEVEDVDNALEELLFSGGMLNRKLLGANTDEPTDV